MLRGGKKASEGYKVRTSRVIKVKEIELGCKNGNRALRKVNVEKAEILNKFFALVFTSSRASHVSRFPEPVDVGWGSKVPHTVSEEQVQDYLMKPNR